MKVYKCDACGQIIEDPYKMKMKEFRIQPSYPSCFVPINYKQKVKIDLCDDCYHNLNNLATTKISKIKEEYN